MGSLSIEQILEASVLRNTQPEWALELEFFRINPEYLLEELMLKLKLQYFGHLLQIADSLEKTLMLERLRAREVGDRG